MKNLIYSIIALIAAPVLLISCSMDTPYDNINNSPTVLESQASGYHISLETALNNLQSFVSSVETKSPSTDKKISEVIMIKNHGSSISRTSEAENDTASTLLYVVNYEDDQGYAVLSADTRLPADVYAFTEKGHAEEEDFYPSENNDVEFNPLGLIYASAKGHNQFVDTIDKDPFRDIDTVIDVFPLPDHPDGEWVITVWEKWQDLKKVSTMIKTKWGQGSPYKDRTGAKYAGCTVVAVAQVMTYNKFPSHINGIRMPYDSLSTSSSISNNSIYADTVAILFEDIYKDCGAKNYGNSGSLLWPKDVLPYLERLGYQNVKINRHPSNFNIGLVYNSLSRGYPVIISALNSDNNLGDVFDGNINAHTWVIDGYVRQIRRGRKIGEKSGDDYGSKSETRELVHCNWGWNGRSDGYFYPGIFSENKQVAYIENDTVKQSSNEGNNYRYFYRIITYSL